MRLTRVLVPLLCALWAPVPASAEAVRTRVELLADHESVAPGQEARLALRLRTDAGWHTYWKDPGESGLPAAIEWRSLAHASTGPWRWPAPVAHEDAAGRSLVLPAESVILIPFSVAATARAGGRVVFEGTLTWLECGEGKCVPREKALSLSIPVGPAAVVSAPNAALFARAEEQARDDGAHARTAAPVPRESGPEGGLDWEAWSVERQQALLEAGRVVFVDFTARWCATCQVNKRVFADAVVADALRAGGVALLRADWTRKNPAVAAELARHGRSAIPFNAFLKKGRAPVVLPEVLTRANVLAGLNGEGGAAGADGMALAGRLALAFAGGLLLNLMPCVFPVLGLKIMHFAEQAGAARRRVFAQGAVFTAGVVLSLGLLAALLRGLRAGGASLGWGFQLQEPAFVLGLAVLFLVLALNMAGVFEMGVRWMGAGAGVDGRGGWFRGAFFSGFLVAVAATPCAAPFLGVALGVALAEPSWVVAQGMFAAVALGLSAPCLALSAAPAWTRLLPRAGEWMTELRQGLSFLLFASVGWLLWVLAAQLESGLLSVFLGLVVVAFACWVYGRWGAVHRARRVRRWGTVAALALVGGTFALWWRVVA
jgi:thiol:disulfide interchange protein DsbD